MKRVIIELPHADDENVQALIDLLDRTIDGTENGRRFIIEDESDPYKIDKDTPRTSQGTAMPYYHDMVELAFRGCGEPVSEESDDVAMALFTLLVCVVKEYAFLADYKSWAQLARDISEQFEFDWINPTHEQEEYMQSLRSVQAFERRFGKPTNRLV